MDRLAVQLGDITKVKVDAIVNAANSSLLGGGGVDGAIHRRGGPEILAECKRIVEKQGGCPTGQAVITGGGNLSSKFVIHTVGPVWHGGQNNEEELLTQAYHNSLQLANKNGCKTIAFPNISTGVYRFPKEKAAQIAFKTCNEFVSNHTIPEKVIFVCFDESNYRIYKELIS